MGNEWVITGPTLGPGLGFVCALAVNFLVSVLGQEKCHLNSSKLLLLPQEDGIVYVSGKINPWATPSNSPRLAGRRKKKKDGDFRDSASFTVLMGKIQNNSSFVSGKY